MVDFKKAEENLDEIMKSPFKKETLEDYVAFERSINDLINEMNSHVSVTEAQLKKQITL